MLSLGGNNVTISLVLNMIVEIYVLWQVYFQRIPFRTLMTHQVHKWSPRFENSENPCPELTTFVFLGSSIVWELQEHEDFMKSQRS